MAQGLTERLAAVGVPDPRRLIVGCRDDAAAVGAEQLIMPGCEFV